MADIPWLALAAGLDSELSQLRAQLHRHPELGNQEVHTAQTVEAYLNACGIETARPFGTAVVGTLRGGLPGPVAALRADMDALPIREETGVPFSSENPGVMHACGHDFHMAAALGAAKLLSGCRAQLPGAVKFFFQPDEEGTGGAQRMIDAGCMDAPAVQAVFGAHVCPDLPAGSVGIRFGKFYAAADVFDVTVRGKSAHGAEPEKGIDALAAAAEMVGELHKLTGLFPGERVVLAVGTFRAGTARNIIADRAEFSGIVRTLGPEARARMKLLLRETLDRVAARWNATVSLTLRASYPGVVNHDGATALVQQAALALLGPRRVVSIQTPTMTTEDFGCFADRAPVCFYHMGVGGPCSLHTPGFLPEASLLPAASALHAAVIHRFLCAPDTL